jgi:hypothetical protein
MEDSYHRLRFEQGLRPPVPSQAASAPVPQLVVLSPRQGELSFQYPTK